MKNEQILKQAISKAVKNGWNSKNEYDADIDFAYYHNTPEIIIFSHNFARAFFGEEWYTEESPEQSNMGYYSSSMDTDDVIFQGMPYTYHIPTISNSLCFLKIP